MLSDIFSHSLGHLISIAFSLVTAFYAMKTAKSLAGGVFGEVCKRLSLIASLFSIEQIIHFFAETEIIDLGETEVYVAVAISGIFCWILYDLGKTLKQQIR